MFMVITEELIERVRTNITKKMSFWIILLFALITCSTYYFKYSLFPRYSIIFTLIITLIKLSIILLVLFFCIYKNQQSKLLGWNILATAFLIWLLTIIFELILYLIPNISNYANINNIFYIPAYLLISLGLVTLILNNYNTLKRWNLIAHSITLVTCLTFLASAIPMTVGSFKFQNTTIPSLTYIFVYILALSIVIAFYVGFNKIVIPFIFLLSFAVGSNILNIFLHSRHIEINHPISESLIILTYFIALISTKQSKTIPTKRKQIKTENILLLCIELLALACIGIAITYYLLNESIPIELFIPLSGIFVMLLVSEYLSYLHNKALSISKEKSMRQVVESSERFKVVFENSPTSLLLLDLSGDIVHTNTTFTEFCGLRPNQVIGHSIGHVIHPEDRLLFDINLSKVLGSDGISTLTIECRYLRVDGDVRWGSTSINHIPSSDLSNEVNADFVIQIEDITNKKIHENELLSMANCDPLTGLWNRSYLATLITKVIESDGSIEKDLDKSNAAKTNDTFAVFFLDLDRFKIINDTLGHGAGDIVLQTTAERLSSIVGSRGEVARLGGDEFVILFYPPTSQSIIELIAEEIKVSISQPILLSHGETIVTCSIGVLMCFGKDLNPSDIMREADAAMYRAKDHGKNCVEIATTKDKSRNLSEMKFTNDLRRALSTNQIKVYYQPIILLKTNEIVGFEALSRWEHPKKGLISPDQFIPLAEDTGLILEIGYYMMEEAFRQLTVWQHEYTPSTGIPLTMNVNLSVSQLRDPKLFRQIEEVKRESKCAVNSMIFEITESAVMGDAKRAIALLYEIRDLGFKLRIDDFGTGYSSLSYLKKMPIDGFKIDKSFVDGLDIDENDTAIVHALLGLAHAMKLTVTAEGIETDRQRSSLRELNCDYGQGFLFSQAVKAKDVIFKDNVKQIKKGNPDSRDTA